MYRVVIDTETGGLEADKHSLLTATFTIVDDGFDVVDTLTILVKHDTYFITPGALEINKINIVEHHKVAEEKLTCIRRLDAFFTKYLEKDPLVPIGHNVDFDLGFIKACFPTVVWRRYLHYRKIDTCTTAQFLQLSGKIPTNVKCSLEKLAEYFGITHIAHTSHGDVDATLEVLKRLLTL